MIAPFPRLPVTLSALPRPLLRGELHELKVTLRCLSEQTGDLALHIKLVRGERRETGWTFDGWGSAGSFIQRAPRLLRHRGYPAE